MATSESDSRSDSSQPAIAVIAHLEAQLAAALSSNDQALEELSTLIVALAHDANRYATFLMLIAAREAARSPEPLPAEHEESWSRIGAIASELGYLSMGALSAARLMRGVGLHLEPIDLAHLTRQVVTSLSPEARQDGASIEYQSTVDSATALVDGALLVSSLERMLTMRLMEGAHLFVRTGVLEERVLIEIEDREWPVLSLEAWFMATGSRREGVLAATRFEMTIVKALMKACRGDVSVQPGVPRGLVVRLSLPLHSGA